jgi:tyrosine-protein phosphatase YwqE
LLEPRPGPLTDSLTEAVDRLARNGFAALIAHPERHPGPDLPERLAQLVARGALVQATAAYLEAPGSAEGMRALAARGVVHVLGSDAHSSLAGRPVRLTGGLDMLREVPRVAGHMDWIARGAPQAIVRGELLTAPYPAG